MPANPTARRTPRARLGLGLTLGLLAACARTPSPPPAADAAGGARLQLKFWDFPDVPVFEGFFDTRLGTDCDFSATAGADGRHYCLPRGGWVVSIFADAQCTTAQRVGFAEAKGAASFFIASPDDACASHERVYKAGAVVEPGAAYDLDGSGRCAPTFDTYYTLGDEVPLDSLVGASEVMAQGMGRIRPRVLQATTPSARSPRSSTTRARRTRSTRSGSASPRCTRSTNRTTAPR